MTTATDQHTANLEAMREITGLTPKQTALLHDYLLDAPNWSGTPWLRESNVGWEKNQLRAMRAIEAAGFIRITDTGERGMECVTFTDAVRPLLPILGLTPGSVDLDAEPAADDTAAPRASRATIPAMGMEDTGPCVACKRTRESKKFPTAIREGAKVRLTECRECRDARYRATR